MLFNEQEIIEICNKYGIEVVKKSGFPLYMGEEMDENFSVEEMMKDSCEFHIDKL